MDDGMMSAVPVPIHLDGVRGCSSDAGASGTACCRRCRCSGDEDRQKGCTSVVCGSVCTRTMLVVVNWTFFVSIQLCSFSLLV